MEQITNQWTSSWAADRGIQVTMDRTIQLSYSGTPIQNRVTLLIDSPRTPADLILLGNRLVWVDSDEGDQRTEEDRTYLFWISESGIWDEMTEALGRCAFSALTSNVSWQPGESGLLLRSTESQMTVLLCLNAILFGWDVYLAPQSGAFLCHISHDQYIDLRARDPIVLKMLKDRLDPWGAEFRTI